MKCLFYLFLKQELTLADQIQYDSLSQAVVKRVHMRLGVFVFTYQIFIFDFRL